MCLWLSLPQAFSGMPKKYKSMDLFVEFIVFDCFFIRKFFDYFWPILNCFCCFSQFLTVCQWICIFFITVFYRFWTVFDSFWQFFLLMFSSNFEALSWCVVLISSAASCSFHLYKFHVTNAYATRKPCQQCSPTLICKNVGQQCWFLLNMFKNGVQHFGYLIRDEIILNL